MAAILRFLLILITAILLEARLYARQELSGDEVEKGCGNNPADIIFVLDESGSIWGPDFKKQIEFVKDVVRVFDTRPGMTHIGTLTYSDLPHVIFQLKQHNTEAAILAALDQVRQRRGGTRTDLGLAVTRDEMFAGSNWRPEVAHIAIVITDGESEYPDMTLTEANAIKAKGITVISIGVGKRINEGEMKNIASDPWSEHYFQVDSYEALEKIKDKLAWKACQVTTKPPPTTTTTTTTLPPPTTTTTTTTTTTLPQMMPGCSETRPADVIFALSDEANAEDTGLSIDFVNSVVEDMHLGPARMQVGMSPRLCTPGDEVRLKDNDSHDGLSLSLEDRLIMGTRTDAHLEYMLREGFSTVKGGRTGAKKIAVIIVDNVLLDIEAAREQAQLARAEGAFVIIVGVGPLVNEAELRELAASPDAVLMTSSYQQLKSLKDDLARKICEGIRQP